MLSKDYIKKIEDIQKEIDKQIMEVDLKNKEYNEILEKKAKVEALDKLIEAESLGLRTALTLLEEYYNKKKKENTESLEGKTTEVVNTFFQSNYDFKLLPKVERGKPTYRLKDENLEGNLEMLLGGAAKQTIGFIFQMVMLKSLNSNFLYSDEGFNSFGIEEIRDLGAVLNTLDLQLILTEHKDEMFEDIEDYKEYKVIKISNKESKVIQER